VPSDEFTDREELIGELVATACNTPRDITFSTAIVGQRRMGKTSVMEQLYNRLFWEEDEVVPIYFTFEAKPTALRQQSSAKNR
jgi:predicted AAA+ superfamily ATPase